MTRTLLRAAMLLALGSSLGLVLDISRADSLVKKGFSTPATCEGEEAKPALVSAKDAATWCARTDVVIADARPESAYTEGHVAGAIHLPCDAGGGVADDAIHRFQGARTIIVYGNQTDDAIPVAQGLLRMHLADVRVLEGGFAGWNAAGLACASGPCAECKDSK